MTMPDVRGTLFAIAVLFSASIGLDAGQLGSRTAEEWIRTLDSPARIRNLKIDETVLALKLRPGDVVADVGAGSGAFEDRLARAVAPAGRVYAVDVDQGLLDNIRRRAAQAGLTNVTTVLGRFTDPALPARDVDVAFIYDVLHHIEDRSTYLENLAGYLKPAGRIAVIDYLPGMGGHKDQPALQVSKAMAAELMAAAGLTPVEEVALFEDKYFVIYAKR
jgi:ubiquinone/menaquinone biosynthesis C-methylase UbiE